MQRFILTFFTLCFFCSIHAQNNIDQKLKAELDSIYKLDQTYRELLSSNLLQTKADSIAAVYKVPVNELVLYLINSNNKIDSSNMARIVQIIDQYGYPGKTLVGEPTNEAAISVIQHSQFIDKYLPIIEKAALKKEFSFALYARMLDRSLMYNGKEQLYGTQGKGFQAINAQTGKKEFTMIIWPIKEPAAVNQRRKEAGFTDTVEENAKRMGIAYKIITLEEFKKMQAQ